MRTLLSRFCEEFNGVLRPVLKPLERAAEMLGEAGPETPGREIVPQLVDIRHQIETLADKVEAQQAYVIIFGPLKSGKSTLMNAVSAAYVSEVTSLPAYPCMVYVSHADEVSFKVHRYNGTFELHKDPAALHMQVNRAHGELAEHIRRVESIHPDEDDGERVEFDPVVHYTDAIRRVDVKVPAGHLSQSGAVLVDTPGLYSRMKFGYDRMTREFRNAAACAIFVVKSDNLFLEQVFAEFNQLLELFSRIFLVVNLDTGKVDLRPDGSLEPSLERRDPLRIIEAFENLAMSAPLKEAAEQGRLRIYPVDLLRAASERLRHPDRPVEEPAPRQSDDEAAYEGQSNFDAFLGDLTDYLNSTEYLVAFLGDSLRQGSTFLGELRELCGQPAVDLLREALENLEAKEVVQRERLAALDRLAAYDWATPFGALQEDIRAECDADAEEVTEKTRALLHAAVEAWFQDDTSLHTLLVEGLAPILSSYRDEAAKTLSGALRARVDKGEAGVLVPHAVSEDLVATAVHLGQFGSEALEHVRLDSREPAVAPPISAEQIPVKRGFWDWILFRSQATVRRRLLGSAARPDQRVPRALKQRRLGHFGKDAMFTALEASRREFFERVHQLQRARILGEYSSLTTEALQNRFQAEREIVGDVRRELEQQMKRLRKVLNHVTTLQAETDRAIASIDELSASYGQTDPALLAQPLDEADAAALPAPVVDRDPAGLEVQEDAPVLDGSDSEVLSTVELTPAQAILPGGTERAAEDALLGREGPPEPDDDATAVYGEVLNGSIELRDVDLAPQPASSHEPDERAR